jgi:micrococcal nuclease
MMAFVPKTNTDMTELLWWWRGRIAAHPGRGGHSAYDGDTLMLEIDRGFNDVSLRDTRLARLNAPELKGPSRDRGLRARDRLRELCPVGTRVYVRTYKDKDKYGRYLADLYVVDAEGSLRCINDQLIAEGVADPAEY